MSGLGLRHNTRGEWYVVAQFVLTIALLLVPLLDGSAPGAGLGIAAGAVCAGGFVFIVLGTVGLGRNLSPFPRPKADAQLVDTGIFAVVRHPIYTGFSLFALGWSALWTSIAALVVAVVLFVFFDRKSRREERWLRAKFDSYAAYAAGVKRLIPYIY